MSSIKRDAFHALSCLQYEVEKEVVADVTAKVTAMFNLMQNEIDEVRAQAISERARADNLQKRIDAYSAELEKAEKESVNVVDSMFVALDGAKEAIDVAIAKMFPEECGYMAVMNAHELTKNVGTIGYLADVLQKIRDTKAVLSEYISEEQDDARSSL